MNKVEAFEYIQAKMNYSILTFDIIDAVYAEDLPEEEKYFRVYTALRTQGMCGIEQATDWTVEYMGLPAVVIPVDPPVEEPEQG